MGSEGAVGAGGGGGEGVAAPPLLTPPLEWEAVGGGGTSLLLLWSSLSATTSDSSPPLPPAGPSPHRLFRRFGFEGSVVAMMVVEVVSEVLQVDQGQTNTPAIPPC